MRWSAAMGGRRRPGKDGKDEPVAVSGKWATSKWDAVREQRRAAVLSMRARVEFFCLFFCRFSCNFCRPPRRFHLLNKIIVCLSRASRSLHCQQPRYDPSMLG